MTALWFLPVLVTVVGVVAVVVAGGRSAAEARRLGDELRRLSGMRPLLLELQEASRSLSGAAAGSRYIRRRA